MFFIILDMGEVNRLFDTSSYVVIVKCCYEQSHEIPHTSMQFSECQYLK